jgi:hypothetical protein
VVAFKSVQKHERWLLESRRLFESEKRTGDGFVFMSYDLFDGIIARWRSDELMTPKEKAYLSEEITVTNENCRTTTGKNCNVQRFVVGSVTKKNFYKGDNR